MVERRVVLVDGMHFTAVKFHWRTTAVHLHVGSYDPGSATVSVDATTRLGVSELRAGVVGAFNGGFQAKDKAGGMMVDGRVLNPLRPGLATLAIDTKGRPWIGVWDQTLPSIAVRAVSYRQNLGLLVDNGRPTAAASGDWGYWGGVVNSVGPEPRSALGQDGAGNLIYVATMGHTLPFDLAKALVAVGAQVGMELDINPAWPVLTVPATPVHSRGTPLVAGLSGEQRSPSWYQTGSERDFIAVVAEPGSWQCSLDTPGGVGPQPWVVTGTGC